MATAASTGRRSAGRRPRSPTYAANERNRGNSAPGLARRVEQGRIVLQAPPFGDDRLALGLVLLEDAPVEPAPVHPARPLQRRLEVLVDELADAPLVLVERVAAAGPDPAPHRVEEAAFHVVDRRDRVVVEDRGGPRPGGDVDEGPVRADLADVRVVIRRLLAPRLDHADAGVDEDLGDEARGARPGRPAARSAGWRRATGCT